MKAHFDFSFLFLISISSFLAFRFLARFVPCDLDTKALRACITSFFFFFLCFFLFSFVTISSRNGWSRI